MKNLAGNKDCDVDIEDELTRAKIDIVRAELPARREVPARLSGKLGPFVLERGWCYWTVSGPMPLDLAEQMYADPIGARDVRVAGHCACPPPKKWTETCRRADGRSFEAVCGYHIDSPEGLRLFADYARKSMGLT